MRRAWRWWRTQPARVRLAVAVLVVVAIGWPATAVADLLGAPIFRQVMYALSWLAPALTGIDLLFTAQVHEQQDDQQRR